MPLVKVFTRKALRVSANELQGPLCEIWGAPKTVLKVAICRIDDMTDSCGEDIYVDLRAKAKEERTPAWVDDALEKTCQVFRQHGYHPSVRLEMFDVKNFAAVYCKPAEPAPEFPE
eukprot:TRINITY_DN111705_c0_g1_i1.p1 TRINITY_DN111705_c0_g1~~TRINITY_DN111705_c0_g1_i1.p1  ORF type:complete len:116 (+),score=26.66 TRINITY_DN111705_c0_g1_i1:83-430(+)